MPMAACSSANSSGVGISPLALLCEHAQLSPIWRRMASTITLANLRLSLSYGTALHIFIIGIARPTFGGSNSSAAFF